MAYAKFWMIVNVNNAYDCCHGEIIPKDQAPRILIPDKEYAEAQLLRLSEKYPFTEFILLEAISLAKEQVHTIDGYQRRVFVVEDIVE